MEKLILLCGQCDTGKTMSLKMLTALLLPSSDDVTKPPKQTRTVIDLWKEIDRELKAQVHDTQNFGIVLKINGKKIGIYTYGDSIPDINDGVDFFEKNPCDIGLMPCHPDKKHFDILVPKYANIMMVLPKKAQKNSSIERQYLENISMATKLHQIVISFI